jgi:hypothetical protein
MKKRHRRLAYKFHQQDEFAQGYSPLYARLFGQVAAWLEAPAAESDPLVSWLLAAVGQRRSLEVTLLLAAGLHREVLGGATGATDLAAYYPTAGGDKDFTDPDFAGALRQAILASNDHLETFISSATVQTNETGRGLCWLLPALAPGWREMHLVDLGASAGLNLLADQRAYRLIEESSEKVILDTGLAKPGQFVTRCRGAAPLGKLAGRAVPAIASRSGCDIFPFRLQTRDDELALMAFIWGDQLRRLARLQEGIAAYRRAEASGAPVKLFPADLPDDLGRFMAQHVPPEPHVPVIVYNTWMTHYLTDRGQSLFYHLEHWASDQDRPVLWLQWEPPADGSEPPEKGWCAWSAGLWSGQNHRRFHLGWVHPHGGEAAFADGLEEWLDFWQV